MSASTLVLVFWLLVLIALFGLVRLLVARRGTDADWQQLVAFGKRLPPLVHGSAIPPEQWQDALVAAPPGLVPGDAPLTLAVVYEATRTYQRMLQSEMKWFAHRLPNPYLWFLAGLRGIALVPFGVAIELDARARARRRALEAHADFQRVVTAVGAVVLFVLLLTTWFGVRAAIDGWNRLD